MKKLIALLFLATFESHANIKIMFDQEIENAIRKTSEIKAMECLKLEEELSSKFPICRVAVNQKEFLDSIDQGQITAEKFNEDVIREANDLINQIEKCEDYKQALQQAEKINTKKAWMVLCNIVKERINKLITQKSDLKCPSSKENENMIEKYRNYVLANKEIDVEKYSVYLNASVLVVSYIAQMGKDHLKKKRINN